MTTYTASQLSPRVYQARMMAIEAHAAQRYGTEPYVKHLQDVEELVSRHGENFQIVAYLHDTLEDTRLDPVEIQTMFGNDILAAVVNLTDAPGANRQERKAGTNKRLAELGMNEPWQILVLIVKAADRLANVRNCVASGNKGLLAMYRKEHKAFREAVLRANLNADMMAEIDHLLGYGPES